MKIKRREHTIPSLNLASLPDLIFTVLFFFMIVTHMRNVTPQVRYQTPQGTELAKPVNKQPRLYIYIGRQPSSAKKTDSPVSIQVNNQIVAPDQLQAVIEQEKQRIPSFERPNLTASLKADRHAPMQLIMQVKQALREADVARVTYSAMQKGPEKPKKL